MRRVEPHAGVERETLSVSPSLSSSPDMMEYRWCAVLRVIMAVGSLLVATMQVFFEENRAAWTVWALGIVSAVAVVTVAAWLLFGVRRMVRVFSHPGSFGWDLVFISTVVLVSGGPSSPFITLFLPLVMLAALSQPRGIALTISSVATASYALSIWLLLTEILPSPFPSLVVTAPPGGVALQVVGLLSGMALLVVATTYLTRSISQARSAAAATERTLVELSEQQRELVDSLPGGIIVTDAQFRIIRVNVAASELVGKREEELLGCQLISFLASIVREYPSSMQESSRQDFTLITKQGREVPIRLVRSPLCQDVDTITGYVYSLTNISEQRAVEQQLAAQERMAQLLASQRVSPVTDASPQLRALIGESPMMKKITELIERVARSDATILIHGESGTGKELVAKALHAGSSYASGPFIPVNCGAIPEHLLESELFGHKKGSFTGADVDHPGLFKHAEGGTLFLDEIGELPLAMQAKLLRVLQDRMVRPVGSTRSIPINVRIVAATNRNLRREVDTGRFREDLFYRLNVIAITLPALRERVDDLPLLIQGILRRLCKDSEPPVISPQAMQILLSYSYPGNVRELENVLERAHVLGGEVILPEHLPETMHTSAANGGGQRSEQDEGRPGRVTEIIINEDLEFPVNLDVLLAHVERRYLERALEASQGGKKRAAELLGINFRSLRYRLQKFGMHE